MMKKDMIGILMDNDILGSASRPCRADPRPAALHAQPIPHPALPLLLAHPALSRLHHLRRAQAIHHPH